MTRKAVGLHVHSPDKDDMLRTFINRAKPSVVKWLDDPGGNEIVQYAKDRGALTMLRVYKEDQQLGAAGSRYVNEITAAMYRWSSMMVAEGINEQFQSANEAARRAEFDIELMKAMDRIGRKAAIGSISTGQPETEFWAAYMPALKHAATYGHYVALHEYGGGPIGMKWGVGENQWNGGQVGNVDPCTTRTEFLRGWWCLRYRRAVDEWRRLGLATIPKIIQTEGGLDDIWPRPGHGGKGYKDYINEHPPAVGDYARQWSWLCQRWAEDEYMVGGCDFGFATRDPQWSSFDMSTDPDTFERVMQEMERLPATSPAPVPVPVPVPGDQTMSEKLSAMLRAEFGDLYDDLRGKLRTNPGGPNGNFGKMNLSIVDGIAVHHTAGPEAITWEATADYHVLTRKFAGIGYHGGIRSGRVALFAEIDTARAHVADENHHLIGWVMAGNYQTDALDPNDVALLRRVIKVLDDFLGRKVRVGGHKDFTRPGYTVCPGNALYAQVSNLRLPEPPPTPGEDLTTLYQALGKWADLAQAQGIQPNPSAALFRKIQEDGFYLLTDESGARGQWPEVEIPGVVAQLARKAGGSEERIYYWNNGSVKWRLRG